MAERTKSIWTEWSFVAGVVVTVAVLGLFSWSLTFPVLADGQEFSSKWLYLKQATPNEIGDTLAGVAGSLAFVWVVVAVLLQATELREQREEFERMADAQSAQAEVLKKQAAVFEIEQKQRDELRAEQLFNEKLRSLINEIRESSSKGVHWAFSNGPFIDEDVGFDGEVHGISLAKYISEEVTIDEAILKFRERLSTMHEAIWDYLHQSVDYLLPEKTDSIPQIVSKLEKIADMHSELSLSQQERLSRMRLKEISVALIELQEAPELWKEAAQ
ncbi:hypothetical protein [Phaeobacter inhibens]|uniref:Uncharacterized protein n=1 Tax=Phaeobacter inhibens TaxID=221822 RepID=A0A2I7KCI6_9RHOB|nr:hypothetical protein [Phaeobacter inhibens]AUR00328.1 hypothetical protein PhaeoP88_02991 [Phaeobacter inhibens]